jgi:LCP family protein required for cell wall assembly
VLLLVAVGGYSYSRSISGLFGRTTLMLDPVDAHVMNILLVGSDSREGITDPEDVTRFGSTKTYGGQRADTILLVQIVPAEHRGVLVSFPRDLWVAVHHGTQQFDGKINAAYAYSAQAMIDTVAALTGVSINHFIEVDFNGFRRMVDAVGGIDVCNAQGFYDPIINFRLSAGVHHLDGLDALQYARTRHATADGDFGRIRRQQEFLRAVVAKLGSPGVLLNPLRVNALARAFAQNVTVDQYMQLQNLIRLAVSLRRIGPSQLQTYSVAGRVGSVGAQSVVFVDAAQSDPLFAALRAVKLPPGPAVSRPAGPAARPPGPATSRRAATPGCAPGA